jgi:cytosine permease
MRRRDLLKRIEEQDFTKSHVPRNRRLSSWLLSAEVAGFAMSSTQFLVGGAIANGFDLRTGVIIAFVGCLLLAVYASLLGYIAARTGSSFALLLAGPFGFSARKLPASLFAFLETGWLAVALGITASFFHTVVGLPEWLWILVFTLVFTTTAFLGIWHMSVHSLGMVPLMTGLVLLAVVHSFTGVGSAGDPLGYVPKEPMSWYVGLNLAVGSFILSSTTSPDITRFARSPHDAAIISVAGFLFGNFLFLAGGAVATAAYGNWDVVQNLVNAGLAGPGIVLILANVWTSFDTGLYTAAVEMAVITRYRRLQWTVILALVSCLVALAGIYRMIVEWLTLLSLLIPPVGGIMLADYFVIRSARCAKDVNPAGLVAWIFACAISLVLNWYGYLMGIGGAVAGFVVYLATASALRAYGRRLTMNRADGA